MQHAVIGDFDANRATLVERSDGWIGDREVDAVE